MDKFGVSDVVPEHSDWYNEFKDDFKPLGENTNAQDLVHFVNALIKALSDMTQSSVNAFHSKIPSYSEASLSSVATGVDKLLDYRQTFEREGDRDKALSDTVQNVKHKLTNAYMNTLVTAMQEVIEYNDTHDDIEKSEAHTATETLWQGQLRTDMQEYLDNGIPDIIVTGDPYEYINNGKLNVIASIKDSNDDTHEVEVTFKGETKKITSTDGKVNVTFDLADGYYEDYVTIVAKDKLTKKEITIENKPVVTVSDIEMYKRFVQALEADKEQSFNVFDLTTHTSLKTLFDKTLAIKVNVSSEREIREVENLSTKLGGKNGHLETLVKSLVQTNRLVWLINNYKIATDDDFAWAEVKGVTPENIEGLKLIIDDYVASFNGGEVKTPSVDDYHNWLNLNTILEDAKKAIEVAEGLHKKEELADAIAKAELILEKVPSWLSAKNELQTRLGAVIAYYDVIESVITSETTYIQSDKDNAQSLVDKLVDGTPKNNLQTRLDAVQVVIDAIAAVETAETFLEDADQVTAQLLVDKIETSNPKKVELQTRLDALAKLKEAIVAVEQAEIDKTQVDFDIAKELVDALPDSPKKEELQERLQAVQDVIDNKSREDQAKDAVSKAEDSLQKEDKDKAQEKVDALEEGELKVELQDRLDALNDHVDAYIVAEKAVGQAEKSKVKTDINAAQTLVDALPNSKAKDSLNERLESLNKYIQAEKAVSKAEFNLLQKHKDEAQLLVNELKNSSEKQALQARLDALQIAIDDKAKDLIDKLVNEPENVTPQELADYTGETVYEEIMDEYIDKIIKESDNLTKDKVIQIVRLLNFLEKSKRSMSVTDIKKYETEFNKAQAIMSVSEYPTPIFLLAIEKYMTDDSVKKDLIEIVATETGKTVEEVQSELDALKSFGQEKLGSYKVQYVDTDGNVLHEDVFTDVPYGKVTLSLALEGYQVITDETFVPEFDLNAKTNGQALQFTVEPIKEITLGSYKVHYLDNETKELIHEETFTDIDFGDVLVKGSLADYEIVLEDGTTIDSSEKTIALSKDNNDQTVEFLVKKFNFFESLEPDETNETNENESSESSETSTSDTPNVEDGTTQQDTQDTQPEQLENEVPNEENVEAQETTVKNKGIASRMFMRVASADDMYLSFSSNVKLEEDHASYLTKALYALEGVKNVKALGSEVTDEYVAQVESYIVGNVYDGEYKEYLLKELGESLNDDDGIPKLTPVHPTPPTPSVKPPVEEVKPPIVTPPVEEITPPTVTNPPVEETKPPTVVIPPPTEIDKGEVEKDNTVKLTESDKGYTWTLENPTGKEHVFEADGVKVTLPLDEFAGAKTVKVEWVLVGKDEYKLVINVDGKQVTNFKKAIKVEKEHGFAYLVRGDIGEHKAMPYTYKNKKFKFETKNIKTPFYFKTAKRSFDDIKGIYSQDAIEELASRYIVQGTSPTTYSPYRNITRSQFSVMIVRALALETAEDTKFSDINGHWAQKEIQALNELGIVQGVTATSFNPNGELTRQQAALMLYRLLNAYGVDMPYSEPNFSDADKLNGEVREAVGALQSLDIFEGSNGKFNPTDKLTRMQMAKVLQRTLALTGNF
ncbi:S-layer homology domain-containing protein [Lysinibacillus sphaericus]|uniref:S-layer homology domain-containing protein n=1 Tax=Lysinibacillus sphaericus TaxID=1421 RepID=UPI003F7B0BF9